MTRKQLAEMGLTAARFDMLSALCVARPAWLRGMGLRQSTLRRVLGVSAPVVTRMVQALEKLRLVRREREVLGDRRQVVVMLTKLGERRIVHARRCMLKPMGERVFRAICCGAHRSAHARFVRMDAFEGYLDCIRARFGDRSCLSYPWGHPDD